MSNRDRFYVLGGHATVGVISRVPMSNGGGWHWSIAGFHVHPHERGRAAASGAVLLVAKLDQLSRDVHFLTGLEKAGVERARSARGDRQYGPANRSPAPSSAEGSVAAEARALHAHAGFRRRRDDGALRRYPLNLSHER
jgi:hypothetical protein